MYKYAANVSINNVMIDDDAETSDAREDAEAEAGTEEQY